MGHKHNLRHKKKKREHQDHHGEKSDAGIVKESGVPRLELVLKCGSAGISQVVEEAVRETIVPGVEIVIVHSGVGSIGKSDVFLAETFGRLILGFEVETAPHLEEAAAVSGVEIRLYDVIYRLTRDLREIAESLVPFEPEEKILGRAEVIALFKSSRKGIILGCQVREGRLSQGDRFRMISAMGVIYRGRIESLHIEKDAVKTAVPPQQVGLKIRDFKRVEIGDQVECYLPPVSEKHSWAPRAGMFTVST